MVSMLIALSIAAERLVEIVKGLVPMLNQQQADPQRETLRQTILQFMAVVAGIVTALVSQPIVREVFPTLEVNLLTLIALGFLVSGGSGFWHSIQGYVNAVKDVKAISAEDVKKNKGSSAQPARDESPQSIPAAAVPLLSQNSGGE
jgi:hypothetical protein